MHFIFIEEKLSGLADECHAAKRKHLELSKKFAKLRECQKKNEISSLPTIARDSEPRYIQPTFTQTA